MAEEPFHFFENSPLGNFSATASGGQGFPTGVILPDLKGYFFGLVDKETLLNDLVNAYKERLNYFNLDFKKYQLSIPELPEMLVNISEHFSSSRKADKNVFLNHFLVEVNTKPWSIEMLPAIEISPNPKSPFAEYKIYFFYTDDVPKDDWDRFVDFISTSNFGGLTEGVLKRTEAIRFTTRRFWNFDVLANRFPIDYQQLLSSAFDKAFGELADDDYVSKRNLYWQAPRSYLEKLPLSVHYNYLLQFLSLDQDMFHEANNSMVKALEIIMSSTGGMHFLYANFNKNPGRLKRIYENLDGTSTKPHQTNQNSKVTYQTIANSTVLASLMLALCQFDSQGINSKRDKRHLKFLSYGKYRMDSNVVFSDSNPGYFDFQQQEYKVKETIRYEEGNEYLYFEWEAIGEKYSLHPLDMVTYFTHDAQGNVVSIPAPAIFIKDIAALREWGEISTAIRIGLDIIMIAFSAATLVGGAGYLFTTLAIADLTVGVADIGVKLFEDELRKSSWGAKFLDAWEEVYLVTGIVTGVAALPSLLHLGAKALFQVGKSVTVNTLKGMLKYALMQVEYFPKFVNNAFHIIEDAATWSVLRIAVGMEKLAKEGVLLIKGVKEGERVEKYFLNYKGVNLVEGSSREIRTELRAIVKTGSNTLENYLEQLRISKTGTGGGFNYISEVESTRMVGQEQPMSCAAACIRQIAKENGVVISEEVARVAAETDGFGLGTDLNDIGPGAEKILTENFVSFGYCIVGESPSEAALIVSQVSDGKPWIASIEPPGQKIHTIIVDKIHDGFVFLRDPWNPEVGFGALNGSTAKMDLIEFGEVWKGSRLHFVIIK